MSTLQDIDSDDIYVNSRDVETVQSLIKVNPACICAEDRVVVTLKSGRVLNVRGTVMSVNNQLSYD